MHEDVLGGPFARLANTAAVPGSFCSSLLPFLWFPGS